MNVEEVINSLKTKELKLRNKRTVAQELRSAAQYLVRCVQDGIREFYNAYRPSVYERTKSLYQGIQARDIAKVTIKEQSVSLKITVGKIIHPSIFSQNDVDVFLLMNDGYTVKSGRHKNIPYFGYRSGAHYIEKAIEKTIARYSEIGLTIEYDSAYVW